MRIISIIIFLNIASFLKVVASDTITVYFNKNWEVINIRDEAIFYRKAINISKNNWEVKDYFISNVLQMNGTFTDNKLTIKQGLFSYYYENGQLESTGYYKKDKKIDKWTYWHENGQLKCEGYFKDGYSSNNWKYWNSKGEKLAEGAFVNDKKDGNWVYFTSTGSISKEEFYVQNHIKHLKSYYDTGKIQFEGNLFDGKAEGEWKYWNIDGFLFLKGNYVQNEKVGKWTHFFPDNTSMTIEFENGLVKKNDLGFIIRSEY